MNITQGDYEYARAGLAIYKAWSAQYVQRNGWTVIPANTPHPDYMGEPLHTARVNRFSSIVERFEFHRDAPERVFCYPSKRGNVEHATTWTGDSIGQSVIRFGRRWHDNFGGTRQAVSFIGSNGYWYHG